MTWLEQLVREYYEIQGYWVRTNVKFGLLRHGGYKGEADVLAFDPQERTLVHIEPSMGAESWDRRKEIFHNKFEKAKPHYDEMFSLGIARVHRIAIAGWGREAPPMNLDDIRLMTVAEFVQEAQGLVTTMFKGGASPPEQYPLLRTLYFGTKWQR